MCTLKKKGKWCFWTKKTAFGQKNGFEGNMGQVIGDKEFMDWGVPGTPFLHGQNL